VNLGLLNGLIEGMIRMLRKVREYIHIYIIWMDSISVKYRRLRMGLEGVSYSRILISRRGRRWIRRRRG